jgi:hypothetical protein
VLLLHRQVPSHLSRAICLRQGVDAEVAVAKADVAAAGGVENVPRNKTESRKASE